MLGAGAASPEEQQLSWAPTQLLLRLAAVFVPQAGGKMLSMIVKAFYCSCVWSRGNAGVGSGLAPYFADLG